MTTLEHISDVDHDKTPPASAGQKLKELAGIWGRRVWWVLPLALWRGVAAGDIDLLGAAGICIATVIIWQLGLALWRGMTQNH